MARWTIVYGAFAYMTSSKRGLLRLPGPKNRGTQNLFCLPIDADLHKALGLTFSKARLTRIIGYDGVEVL